MPGRPDGRNWCPVCHEYYLDCDGCGEAMVTEQELLDQAGAAMSETVECFRCGKQVRLRKDGTYATHGWTKHGVKRTCERSGEVHHRHSGSFRIITRNPTRWLCECLCGESFLADTYDAVEKQWSEHGTVAGVPA